VHLWAFVIQITEANEANLLYFVKILTNQNVMFDWTADITGTGDRSEYIVESD